MIRRNREWVEHEERENRLMEVRAAIREGRYPTAEAAYEAVRRALASLELDGGGRQVVKVVDDGLH